MPNEKEKGNTMKKNLFMIIAAGMLVFGTASAETNTRPASETLQSGVRNAPLEQSAPNREQFQKRFKECRPDERMHTMRHTVEGHQHRRLEMMQERLGLNRQQSEEIQKLMQKEISVSSREHQELMELNHKLQAESLKSRPDKKVINALSEKIGKQHTTLARLRSTHLAEVASVLTPEQRNTMLSMMSSRPMRGGFSKPIN